MKNLKSYCSETIYIYMPNINYQIINLILDSFGISVQNVTVQIKNVAIFSDNFGICI